MKRNQIIFIFLLILLCTSIEAKSRRTAVGSNTFSIYAEGGASTAFGLQFRSVNPPRGLEYSPAVSCGLSYEFARSVRIGLNYDFTKLKRQQRLSAFEPGKPTITKPGASYNGGIAYREFWTHLNSADLSAEYNFSNLMPALKKAGVNLYLGTGAGYLFGNGNTYEISLVHEEWFDLESFKNGAISGDDWISETRVTAQNSPHDYQSAYIPATFNAEFVLTKSFVLGLNCSYRYLLGGAPLAPAHLLSTGIVLRFIL